MNLNRSPFLRRALESIRNKPGCCKADVCGGGSSRTRSYRYTAIDRLIRAGLVRNYSVRTNRYILLAVDE